MSCARTLMFVSATVVIAPTVLAQVSFQTATDFAAGDGPTTLETSAIASGDFDGDNDADLVVANRNSDELVLLTTDGFGVFTSSTAINVGTRPVSIVALDLSRDGILDLAVALLGDDQVAVLIGVGNGSFQAPPALYDVGDSPMHVAAGDIDGQNGLDLLTANEQDDTVTYLLNNGDGTFASAVALDVRVATGATRSEPNGSAIGDFDGDGLGDFAVALAFRDEVGILLQNDDGSFAAMTLHTVGRDPTRVLTRELDGDNNLDLVVANTTHDTVTVLLGDGGGDFTVDATYSVGNNPEALALADLDDDGNLDLVTANREGDNVSVLLGDGAGRFGTPSNFAVGGAPSDVVVENLNDDNDLDIATANQEGSLVLQDDVSVLFASTPIIPDPFDTIDCGNGCGPAGLTPLLLTLLGVVGMKRSWRARRR